MNERVNELAKHAWNLCPDPHGETTFDALTKFEQKFAELIVRECADRCEMSPYPHPNYSVAIKKHFGVEE